MANVVGFETLADVEVVRLDPPDAGYGQPGLAGSFIGEAGKLATAAKRTWVAVVAVGLSVAVQIAVGRNTPGVGNDEVIERFG